jgi:hypothetical protein
LQLRVNEIKNNVSMSTKKYKTNYAMPLGYAIPKAEHIKLFMSTG